MPSIVPHLVRRRRATRTLACLAAACALTPAAAHAAAVVYVEDHDVVVASPDGQVKQQLTTDGGPDTNYVFPVRDDAGNTVAARHASESSDATLYRWNAQGERTDMNVLPKPGLLLPVLPLRMAISRDGRHVAYGWSYTDPDMSRRSGIRVLHPEVYTPFPRGSEPDMEGWESPTFWGDRLVVSSGWEIYVQDQREHQPFHWFFTRWLTPSPGLQFRRATIHPDGRSFALEVSNDAGQRAVGFGRGVPNDPSAQLVCDLPAGPNPADLSYSPDGRLIAWRDDEGVKVAGAPDLDSCALSSPAQLISATGTNPSLGGGEPYVAPPPGPPGPPEPPAPPRPPVDGSRGPGVRAGGRGAQRSMRLRSAGRARLRAALARGLRVRVAGGRRGARVTLVGRVRKAVVARGSARIGRDGGATVTLRFTAPARKRLLSARQVTVTVSGGGATLRIGLKR